jgi:hypothetical protein
MLDAALFFLFTAAQSTTRHDTATNHRIGTSLQT